MCALDEMLLKNCGSYEKRFRMSGILEPENSDFLQRCSRSISEGLLVHRHNRTIDSAPEERVRPCHTQAELRKIQLSPDQEERNIGEQIESGQQKF